jgi:hypothetical protein
LVRSATKGIPILSIHDSFLIQQLKFGDLFTAMALKIDQVVKEELGIVLDKTVRMKVKGAEAGLINAILADQYALVPGSNPKTHCRPR